MLAAFVLSCALHAAPVELAPPSAPAVSTEARLKRFFAAFGGGLAGLAVGLGSIALGDLDCPNGPCVNALHGVGASFTPLLVAVGTSVGFRLAGGDGAGALPFAVAVPTLILGQALLLVAREANVTSPVGLLPFGLGAGVLLAAGAALALDLRATDVERLGVREVSASFERVAAPAGLSVLCMLPGAALAMVGGLLGGPVFGGLLSLVTLPGAALAAWGLHHALGGKGTVGAALLGAGVGALVMVASSMLLALNLGSFNPSPARDVANGIFFVETMVLTSALAPVLALEASHTAVVGASLPRVSVGAAPLANGAMLGASLRF